MFNKFYSGFSKKTKKKTFIFSKIYIIEYKQLIEKF